MYSGMSVDGCSGLATSKKKKDKNLHNTPGMELQWNPHSETKLQRAHCTFSHGFSQNRSSVRLSACCHDGRSRSAG